MSEPAVSFAHICRPLQAQIDDALAAALRRYRGDAPERLIEAMRYSLLGGGKRLRPILVLLACEACGGETDDAMPAACAIEMIHTYSLIHDDLPAMDDDVLRRGRATCHMHFDEATAILAGDGLLTLAFEVLATDVRRPEVAAACCADLASAAGIAGMVGGQMSDLQAETGGRMSEVGDQRSEIGGRRSEVGGQRSEVGDQSSLTAPRSDFRRPTSDLRVTVEVLEDIHRRKTGRLLRAALTLGARIAGASDETRSALERYGECIGLAFQIADDLLDVTGEAARMGKEVRKDTDHGKLTYPSLLGEAESRRKARELIEEARGCLVPLGEAGRRLESLADFVLERDH